jgi:hypothetical protein
MQNDISGEGLTALKTKAMEKPRDGLLVLVTGSRNWTDRRRIVLRLLDEPDGTTIIQGGATGADDIAKKAADAIGYKVITVRADWTLYGRNAGPIRNRRMLDMKPDKVIAFCINSSRGTMDCVTAAMERGIPVELIDVEELNLTTLRD